MAGTALARDLLDRGIEAFRTDRLAEAEALLGEAAQTGAHQSEALFYLAAVLAKLGRMDEAASVAARAYDLFPSFDTAFLGGQIALQRYAAEEAFLWAQRCEDAPEAYFAKLKQMGEMGAAHGCARAAATCFAAALRLQPANFAMLHNYYVQGRRDPDAVIAALETFMDRNASEPQLVAKAAWLLVAIKESTLRAERGLPPTGASPAELHFHLARDAFSRWKAATAAWLAADPSHPDPHGMMALIRIAYDDIDGAERHLAPVRKAVGLTLMTAAHFSPAFFAEVESAAASLKSMFPPIETLVRGEPHGPRVFVPGDFAYFERYGWRLAKSFAAHRPKAHLHLHIFDIDPDMRAPFLARLAEVMGETSYSVDCEWTGLKGGAAARVYYHAIRFVRMALVAEMSPYTICALDMDSLFNRSPDVIFPLLADSDIAATILPGRADIHSQIAAGTVAVAPTAVGRSYLRHVAGYLAACHARQGLVWGIDQIALYAIYAKMRPLGDQLRFIGIPHAVYTGELEPDVVIWSGKCEREDPGYERFMKAYAKYS